MIRASCSRFFACSISTALVAVLQAALFLMPAQAHTTSATQVSTAASTHVTILVLDMSGSMAQNDRDGLRCSAANAYIDLSHKGDFIGVIGLDNNNDARGGPHNFQSGQVWVQPKEMATFSERQDLRQVIAQKSHNCQPDNTTPTYDALNQALSMLGTATQNGQIGGSVILLTDGVPYPDTKGQIDTITSELLPQFKQHNWPVDTIALGQDTSFHGFLKGIADTTSGKFYDDGKGVVAGVSPLNIAPFFVDIFARRNGRTVGPTIDPTVLGAGTTKSDFQVSNFVAHLDVIAVKDQPTTTVTLTTPSRQSLPPAVAGTLVSTDAHYAIFSIDGPQPGNWTLNVSGSGQFLMDSLVDSTLQVSITSPTANPALPLGQEITLAATVNYQGNPVSGGQFTLTGSIAYANDTTKFYQPLVLSDSTSPGMYTVKVTVPENKPPGSYEIKVSASQISSTPLSTADVTVRLERFPLPFFISSQTHQPTEEIVSSTVVQWDPVLQFLYGSLLGGFPLASRWPLQNLPALPYANMGGQVELQGQPYSSATVIATATPAGTKNSIPVTVIDDGEGRFHIQFPALAQGDYTVTFKTSGTFEDSHGDFGTTPRQVRLSIKPATPMQEEIALLITFLLYPILLLLTVLLLRYPFLQPVKGKYTIGKSPSEFSLKRSSNPLVWLRRRNLSYSNEVFNLPGLQMQTNYDRKGGVRVRARGLGSDKWYQSSSTRVSKRFERVERVLYHPSGQANDSQAVTYTFVRQGSGAPSNPSDGKSGGSISGPSSQQTRGDSISGPSKRQASSSSKSAGRSRKSKNASPPQEKRGI